MCYTAFGLHPSTPSLLLGMLTAVAEPHPAEKGWRRFSTSPLLLAFLGLSLQVHLAVQGYEGPVVSIRILAPITIVSKSEEFDIAGGLLRLH
jgi:hypothetical protein